MAGGVCRRAGLAVVAAAVLVLLFQADGVHGGDFTGVQSSAIPASVPYNLDDLRIFGEFSYHHTPDVQGGFNSTLSHLVRDYGADVVLIETNHNVNVTTGEFYHDIVTGDYPQWELNLRFASDRVAEVGVVSGLRFEDYVYWLGDFGDDPHSMALFPYVRSQLADAMEADAALANAVGATWILCPWMSNLSDNHTFWEDTVARMRSAAPGIRVIYLWSVFQALPPKATLELFDALYLESFEPMVDSMVSGDPGWTYEDTAFWEIGIDNQLVVGKNRIPDGMPFIFAVHCRSGDNALYDYWNPGGPDWDAQIMCLERKLGWLARLRDGGEFNVTGVTVGPWVFQTGYGQYAAPCSDGINYDRKPADAVVASYLTGTGGYRPHLVPDLGTEVVHIFANGTFHGDFYEYSTATTAVLDPIGMEEKAMNVTVDQIYAFLSFEVLAGRNYSLGDWDMLTIDFKASAVSKRDPTLFIFTRDPITGTRLLPYKASLLACGLGPPVLTPNATWNTYALNVRDLRDDFTDVLSLPLHALYFEASTFPNGSFAIGRTSLYRTAHPVQAEACIGHASCSSCVADPGCGWCYSNGACLPLTGDGNDTRTVPYDDRFSCAIPTAKTEAACDLPADVSMSTTESPAAHGGSASAVVDPSTPVVVARLYLRDVSGNPTTGTAAIGGLVIAIDPSSAATDCVRGAFDDGGYYPIICTRATAGALTITATLGGASVPGSVGFTFLADALDEAATVFSFPPTLPSLGTVVFSASFHDSYGNAAPARGVQVALAWTPEPAFASDAVVVADDPDLYRVELDLPDGMTDRDDYFVSFLIDGEIAASELIVTQPANDTADAFAWCTNQSFQDLALVDWIPAASLIALGMLATAVSFCVYRKASHGSLFFAFFALADLLTDVMFVLSLWSTRSGGWALVGVVALGIPIVVNLTLTVWFVWRELRSEAFTAVMSSNLTGVSLICLLSVFNLNSLVLFKSKLFGTAVCQAPLSRKGEKFIRFSGLTNVMLEDIPQLALVIFVSSRCTDIAGISLISVLITCLSILLALIKRVLACLLVSAEDRWTENKTFVDDGDESESGVDLRSLG